MACVAVNSLVRTIELEFLQPQPRPIVREKDLISFNKELIQSLYEKLGFLMELFDENRMDDVEATKLLETKLRDVAFKVEDEIELQVVHLYEKAEDETAGHYVEQSDAAVEKTRHSLRLHHILQQAIQEIDGIKEDLVKVKNEYEHVIALQGRKPTLEAEPKYDEVVMAGASSQHASHSEDIMVGKHNEFETIKKMLIEHPSKQREAISIKGTGGIGKTTLARQVYEDPSIRSHFDKQGWVVASQHHNKRQMLVGLLKSMGKLESGTDEVLAEKLYQGLKGQRYMVVMDDVWSEEAWDAVKACFPDDGNGSRVLLTTRLEKIANYFGFGNDFSHQMRLLDQSESWNLFHERACRSRGAEFETIGRIVAEKCKGLPLAIVVIAGLFSKLNTLDEWKSNAKALNLSATTTIDEECSRVLSLSYNHLPHNLKACFLYLGVFPEDSEINANKLARLWFAEGLVKTFENESFDVAAKRYIQELMDRNLILVSIRSCCGRKIKAFRMHDLLHAFCVRKAQNENLLHVVHESGSNFPPKGFRWVSIQSVDFDILALYSSSKNCRSILYFHFLEEISLNYKIFNLLRVLFTPYNKHMRWEIVDLIHLRYLPLVLDRDLNNVKLFRAWNLQTLHILADNGRNYLEFPQLLYFNCEYIRRDPPKFVHQNLQSIYRLEPYHCTKEFFTNVPYLKKVRITGGRRDCNDCIKNLACLQQLERLYIHAIGWRSLGQHMIPINNQIVLLKNLKKLSFESMRFEWKGINVLSKLPMLEVLKLFNFSCIGEEWELPEEEQFCQLIFLGIDSTDLKHWRASAVNFPKLEHLLLYYCDKLEKIPEDFAEISVLKSIELKRCLRSAVDSAKQIQEDQHDQGNKYTVVIENYTIEPDNSDEFESDEDEGNASVDEGKMKEELDGVVRIRLLNY